MFSCVPLLLNMEAVDSGGCSVSAVISQIKWLIVSLKRGPDGGFLSETKCFPTTIRSELHYFSSSPQRLSSILVPLAWSGLLSHVRGGADCWSEVIVWAGRLVSSADRR